MSKLWLPPAPKRPPGCVRTPDGRLVKLPTGFGTAVVEQPEPIPSSHPNHADKATRKRRARVRAARRKNRA